ncbi:MAG: ATP synthase subunit C [Candidatus Nanohaloarchaea archaeon]
MAIFSPAISAAFAIGLAAIGSGIAIGRVGAASAGAIAENPEIVGITIIYVAFAEAVSIYGLLIALLILFT